MRSRLFLCFLPLGLFTAACGHSERMNTAADVASDDSGSGSPRSGETAPSGKGPPDPVRPGAPMVTFPGFEVLPDGRSVISVDTTGPTTVTEQKAEGRLIYTLSGVSVPYKVNKLPLITTNFPTQVTSVEVEQIQGGGGASLIIQVREPAKATIETSKIEGGTRVTITLPKSDRYSASSQGGAQEGASWEDSEGGPRRHHGKPGSTDVETADQENAKNGKEKEKEKKHTKRVDRQPIPYVDRHITLSYMTLAPDVGLTLFGGGSGNPNVWLSSGIRWGIIDQIEVEATPHSFRFAPSAGFARPSIGATFAFFRLDVEMAGRIRFYLPIDSVLGNGFSIKRPNVGPVDPVLEFSLPFIFHLGQYAKIDTGVNVSMDFRSPIGVGLAERLPSPLFEEPGIPLKVIFQPVRAFWIGAHTGFELQRFDDAAQTSFIPLGAEAGITAYDAKRPNADLGIRFDSPRLFAPGATQKIQGDFYSFAAWLRWYYYL